MIPAEDFELPKVPSRETPVTSNGQIAGIQEQSGTQAKNQGLPEDAAEAGSLADRIKQVVSRETSGSVRNLQVEVTPTSVNLTGTCRTYHTKQKAQNAAMPLLQGRKLTNTIVVQ